MVQKLMSRPSFSLLQGAPNYSLQAKAGPSLICPWYEQHLAFCWGYCERPQLQLPGVITVDCFQGLPLQQAMCLAFHGWADGHNDPWKLELEKRRPWWDVRTQSIHTREDFSYCLQFGDSWSILKPCKIWMLLFYSVFCHSL